MPWTDTDTDSLGSIDTMIGRIHDLIEGDIFPERIAVACEQIAQQLCVANLIAARDLRELDWKRIGIRFDGMLGCFVPTKAE